MSVVKIVGKWEQDEHFADHVAKATHDFYNTNTSINKGKPRRDEWTLLASIVMTHQKENEYTLQVISIGTGTKCIGKQDMSKEGNILNDSHAEVLTRRSFQQWIYYELEHYKYKVFIKSNSGKLKIRDDVHFHFYISQTPCGDASIYPRELTKDVLQEICKKRKFDENFTEHDKIQAIKKRKTIDNQRTGAKPVAFTRAIIHGQETEKENQDEQKIGILRTKPGRGPRSTSMSCSDKIAKWNIIGLQGSLLNYFIEPIYISSIIIGDWYHQESIERALYKRIQNVKDLPNMFKVNKPKFLQTKVPFMDARSDVKKRTCATSINWNAPDMSEITVSHKGIKQGMTSKMQKTPKARSRLCKIEMFLKFHKLCNLKEIKHPNLENLIKNVKKDFSNEMTYYDVKQLNTDYQRAKKCLYDQAFKDWIVHGSEFEQFKLSF